MRILKYIACISIILLSSGCTSGQAPSVFIFGSYFPSWLMNAFAGVIGSVLIRLVFIKIGVDDILPWRLLVYTCLAISIGLALSMIVFGR